MPKNITSYRIFIGSPGGLEEERRRFRDAVEKYSRVHARCHDVEFEPVGWEDTLPGKGRPQSLINEDLETCDFAIFVFHDRWGSPSDTGSGKVGTEEEWEIAEHLYSAEGGRRIQNMALYFKAVPPAQMKDPGRQLQPVLDFKSKVFEAKQHLCGSFDSSEEFVGRIEEHLASWLARHVRKPEGYELAKLGSVPEERPTKASSSTLKPDFAFWMEKAAAAQRDRDQDAALTFVSEALSLAKTNVDRAKAYHLRALANFYSDRLPEGLRNFEAEIAELSDGESLQLAAGLFNKGVTLGELGRSEEELAVYDEILDRFEDSREPGIGDQVAKALVNKGVTLAQLGRSQEALGVYDKALALMDESQNPALSDRIAKALVNKGVALGRLDRDEEALGAYDMILARFKSSDIAAVREQVARAMVNKGVALGALGRHEEEVVLYQDIVHQFDAKESERFREIISTTFFNMACVYANMRKVEYSINSLEEWSSVNNSFECGDITSDKDFDAIRSDPIFIEYLQMKGCN